MGALSIEDEGGSVLFTRQAWKRLVVGIRLGEVSD
jgi:hypothetical protein